MKKYSFSALAIGLALSTVGFSHEINREWRFNGTYKSEITDYTKYSLNLSGATCAGFGDIPCVIYVPEGIDTPTELKTFFAGKTAEEIMDLATGKKISDYNK